MQHGEINTMLFFFLYLSISGLLVRKIFCPCTYHVWKSMLSICGFNIKTLKGSRNFCPRTSQTPTQLGHELLGTCIGPGRPGWWEKSGRVSLGIKMLALSLFCHEKDFALAKGIRAFYHFAPLTSYWSSV